ncbi:MAG: DMT family transporter [Pyrinomonadaceae bacterium]
MKTFIYTAFALVAFAFNSILCRMALRPDEIDPAGFTAIRLASGAVTLGLLVYLTSDNKGVLKTGHWLSAIFLSAYAICFSFAYMGLNAGTGALILFGSVQLSMIGVAMIRGESPSGKEWLGLVVAAGGLVYLLWPGLTTSPPTTSAALMAAAGIAWGGYTLRGKGSSSPLADTAGNFIRTVPMAAVAAVVYLRDLHLTQRGVLLAVISGAIASGIGYTAWYAALKHHTATRAAILQLSVPLITAAGGVLLLSEAATTRLWISAALILGGIAVATLARR